MEKGWVESRGGIEEIRTAEYLTVTEIGWWVHRGSLLCSSLFTLYIFGILSNKESPFKNLSFLV